MKGVLVVNTKVQQDAAEIIELIAQNMHGKYVAPFEEAIKCRSEMLNQNPPPEIALLSALKPFVDSKCCTVIDKLVSSYNMATLAKVMAEDLAYARGRGNIHPMDLVSRKPRPETMSRMQFSTLGILLPLIILLIFVETH
jgi:hypothetical protein